MSDSLNLKIARHLRPGDVIIHAGHPADLIDVVDYGPEVLLIWGVSWDDQISVGPSEAFNVLNRFASLQAAPPC